MEGQGAESAEAGYCRAALIFIQTGKRFAIGWCAGAAGRSAGGLQGRAQTAPILRFTPFSAMVSHPQQGSVHAISRKARGSAKLRAFKFPGGRTRLLLLQLQSGVALSQSVAVILKLHIAVH
jgi:hypothetical protein